MSIKHLEGWFRLQRRNIGNVLQWIADHLHQRNHQIVVSIAIGIVSGLVAVVLKWSTHAVRDWVYGGDPTRNNLLFIFFPAIGIALTVLYVKFILRKPFVTGLSGLAHAISAKKNDIPAHEMYSHVVTTSLTIGFGGSAGMEAPIVRTGAAIGANLARILRADRQKMTLFLACGAAAGISAIFNSPVAGVIFAFEALVTDIAVASFIPLLIAAATGAVVSKWLYYEQLFFLPSAQWSVPEVPFFIAMGILCGLFSVYMVRINTLVRSYINQLPSTWLKVTLSGLALGLLIFLIPPLFGEGYDLVNHLLRGEYREVASRSLAYDQADNPWVLIAFVAITMMVKMMATALTIGSGGNGGVFAPSMFSGAALGFVFAHAINQLGWVNLSENNFIGVAMAGILSGVFKSPLTGIFLIAEVTGGYSLFVPLMIVSATAYFVAYYFEPHSIFTRELFLRGLWVPPHEKDLLILKHLDVGDMVEDNFSPIHPSQTLGELVQVIARSYRNVFPVTDEEDKLLGIILLDDVRKLMFQPDQYDKITVKELMHRPPAVVQINDPMEKVMKLFEHHHAWNLPVVKDGVYQGFISKSTVFNRYREELQGIEERS